MSVYKIGPATYDSDDLDDHIMGAGADTYPWFGWFRVEEDGYYLKVEDPDTNKWVEKYASRGSVASIMRSIVENKRPYVGPLDYVRDQILTYDIDADGADVILQIAVLGEVVYG